jgi:hypothetical protein
VAQNDVILYLPNKYITDLVIAKAARNPKFKELSLYKTEGFDLAKVISNLKACNTSANSLLEEAVKPLCKNPELYESNDHHDAPDSATGFLKIGVISDM